MTTHRNPIQAVRPSIPATIQHPLRAVRAALRDTLIASGAIDPPEFQTAADLESTLRSQRIDLAAFDADDDSCLQMCRDIRTGCLGENPFAGLIAVTSDAGSERIRKIIDAGVDSIVVFPFTPTQLRAHVRAATKRTRDFVIAGDYIGPDRRKDIRAGTCRMLRAPDPIGCTEESIRRSKQALEGHIRQTAAHRLVYALARAAACASSGGGAIDLNLHSDAEREMERIVIHAPKDQPPPHTLAAVLDLCGDIPVLFASGHQAIEQALLQAKGYAAWTGAASTSTQAGNA